MSHYSNAEDLVYESSRAAQVFAILALVDAVGTLIEELKK